MASPVHGGLPEPASSQSIRSELSGSAGNVVQARDISGGVHFHDATPSLQARPAQLPGDVSGFVNRAHQLQSLDGMVAGDDAGEPGALRVAMVVGTAGVGKTSLAVHWAHRIRSRFPGGQLYVNLHGYDPVPPVPPADVLARFLRALGIPLERIPPGEDERAALFRSAVADRKVLVILDNAATAGQIRPLLPGDGSSLVVITSRTRLSGLAVRIGAHRVSVETLSQAESIELLRAVLSRYRVGDDEAALAELARLCAYLPLALRIAAERAAARPRMPLRELIADLRDESGLWDALSAEDAPGPAEAEAVRTVFHWSYRALSPEAARLFRLLGLNPGLDFALPAAAALAELPAAQARRLLDTLAGAHLLEECGHNRYQFHDLLRAYALDQAQREEPEESRREALRRVLAWYLHAAATAAQASAGAYRLPVTLEPMPETITVPVFDDGKSAITWYEAERENLTTAVHAAAHARMHRIAWQISAVLTPIIVDREPADTWLPAQQAALAAARRSSDRYGEAITLENLGIAHRHLYHLPEAAEALSAALAAYDDVHDTLGQMRCANGLGVVHLFARRLDDAVAGFEHAAALATEHEDQQAYAGAFTRNIAWALLERGDLQHAEPLLHQALGLLRAAGEPLEEAEALTLLAALYRRQERLAQARAVAERALAIAGEVEGTLFEALALLELGRIAVAQRENGEALGHLHQAAALFQRIGRADLQAAVWDATGEAYRGLERWQEAADFHRRAATEHRTRADRWSLALSLADLAAAQAQLQDATEALTNRREAIELLTAFTDPIATAKRAEFERDT